MMRGAATALHRAAGRQGASCRPHRTALLQNCPAPTLIGDLESAGAGGRRTHREDNVVVGDVVGTKRAQFKNFLNSPVAG
jgi:hypothetical protein